MHDSYCTFAAIASGQDADPLANRTLSGSIDFGSSGRQIATGGLLNLGTLTLTSELLDGEDTDMDGIADNVLPSFSIDVSTGGYAFLSNDLLIRSVSGTDVQFDGPNQSHTFNVFQVGTGAYDHQNVGLSGSTSYTNGSGEVIAAYGGNWFWEADYSTIAGETATIARSFDLRSFQPSRVNPLTLRTARSGNEIDDQVNRVTSSAPRIPSVVNDDTVSPLQLRFVDDQTPTLERQNTLFSVANVENQALPEINFDVAITGSGATLGNRSLNNQTLNLGRFSANQDAFEVDRSDTLTIGTRGSDDQLTRVQLNSFDLSDASSPVTASFTGSQVFDGSEDTAEVSITGNFTIDPSSTNLGARSVTADASSAVASVENLPGESLTSLNVGYNFSVVADNEIDSESITYFTLDGADSNFSADSVAVTNNTIRRRFSTTTHTAIDVQRNFSVPFDDNVHTVTLSEGNGVTAEGLADEQVIATTSFDVHRVNVQSTTLQATKSGQYGEGDSLTFSNDTAFDASKIQAEVFLIADNTTGSTRWTLPGLDTLDLSAGGSLTISPTFDDSGLAIGEPGSLGRRFRTSVDLTFQSGLANLNSLTVDGTSVGDLLGESDNALNVLGSRASRQTRSYVFERNIDVQSASGTATLAVGSTLAGEGITLQNTAANTSAIASIPTEFRVIDSEVLGAATFVEATFFSLDSLSGTEFEAVNTTPLISDIVDFSGLDGIQHVIDLSFDASLISGNLAEVLWLAPNDEWVNAVLGNSNITLGDDSEFGASGDEVIFVDGESFLISEYLDQQRFDGSYDDYLLSLANGLAPELGVFGSDGFRAWAIIDHNSVFALAVSSAVPEPSSTALLGLLMLTGTVVRRRR